MGPLDAVKTLRAASAALLSQGLLHGELAKLDLQEEKTRLLGMVIAVLAGLALASCAFLFTGAFAIIALWDTKYRTPCAAVFALLAGGGAFYAWVKLKELVERGSKSFAASREEFAADAALIRLSL